MDRSRILGLAAGAVAAATISATAAGLPFVAFTPLKAAELRPWTAYDYWRAYPGDARVRRLLALGGLLGSGLLVGGALLVLQARGAGAPGSREHDARFATDAEIEAAGLLAGPVTRLGAPGLLVGIYKERWVCHAGDGHIDMPWGTSSGKTRSFIVPNLLNWRGSAVVLDLKRELYAMTGRWRASLGDVWVIDPLAPDGHSHAFNPLQWIPNDGRAVTEIQKFTRAILPDEANVPIWKPSARNLALGIALYLLATPGQALSFGRILRIANHPDGELRFFHWLLETRGAGTPHALSEPCRTALSGYMHCAPETREGFKANLIAALEPFLNPQIDAATASTSKWLDPHTLRERAQTVYLTVPLDALDVLGRIMSLSIDAMHNANLERAPAEDSAIRVPLWMAPDEIGQMPAMRSVRIGLTAARSYGIRWALPYQSPAQARDTYGPNIADVLSENCDMLLFSASNSVQVCKRVSDLLGTTTRTVASSATNRLGASNAQTERVEPLLWPHEARVLDAKRLIVIPRGKPAFIADKIDLNLSVFASRLGGPVAPPPPLEPVDYSDLERVPEEPGEPEAPKPRRKPAARAKPGDFDQAVADALGPRA